MLASIYCRISRDRVGAGLGVATQEADCRELARKLGWTIVTVHTDNDLSAHSGRRRPGYEALLTEIRAGEIGGVLAWHTDRLHRSPVELEAYVTACETHGVVTHTVKAGQLDLSTASGLMVARILGATARHEVDHMIERQKRAKKRSAEAGQVEGWPPALRLRQRRRHRGARRKRSDRGPRPRHCWPVRRLRGIGAAVERRRQTHQHRQRVALEYAASHCDPTTERRVDGTPRRDHRQGGVAGDCAGGGVAGAGRQAELIRDDEPMVWPRQALARLRSVPLRVRPHRDLLKPEQVAGLPVSRRLRTAEPQAKRRRRLRQSRHRGAAPQTGCSQLGRPRSAADEVPHLRPSRSRCGPRLDSLASFYAQGLIDAQQLTEGTRQLNVQLSDVRSKIGNLFDGSALAGIVDTDDAGSAWLEAPLDRQRAVIDALAVVTLLRGGHGRPAGWQPGQTYFRPELVKIEWRQP